MNTCIRFLPTFSPSLNSTYLGQIVIKNKRSKKRSYLEQNEKVFASFHLRKLKFPWTRHVQVFNSWPNPIFFSNLVRWRNLQLETSLENLSQWLLESEQVRQKSAKRSTFHGHNLFRASRFISIAIQNLLSARHSPCSLPIVTARKLRCSAQSTAWNNWPRISSIRATWSSTFASRNSTRLFSRKKRRNIFWWDWRNKNQPKLFKPFHKTKKWQTQKINRFYCITNKTF